MMKAYLSAVLFVCLFGTCLGETTYFDCFKDRCIRGKQYCVPARERCYRCEDLTEHCGTSVIPRDCDSYCMELTLKDVELRLNSTLGDKMALEETLKDVELRLNSTLGDKMAPEETFNRHQKLLENSTNELEIVKEENERLEKEKDKQHNFVEATPIYSRNNYTALENKLKDVQEDQKILIIALVFAMSLVVLLAVLLVIFKSQHGRCRRCKEECIARKNFEDPESPVQLSTEGSRGEETDKLIPGAGVTKDSSDDNTNDSEDTAGMADDEDTSDTTSDRNESNGDGARGTEGAGRGEENCWRKNTPEVLKGIQPTGNKSNELHEKVFG